MTKEVKALKKENDTLKSQINLLQEELREIRKKIEYCPVSDVSKELRKSVDFVSDEYDELKSSKSQLESDLKRIDHNLTSISKKVFDIEEAIESMMAYSYQYNIKILGIPKIQDGETAEETASICLKLFNELGAKVNDNDIDIAHRLQSRNGSNNPAIVCKFTRRLAKESVMSKRREIRNVNFQNVVRSDVPLDHSSKPPIILEHLTPKKQELLRLAKDFEKEYNFEFCWVKNQDILLRETTQSRIFKIRCEADLEILRKNDQSTPPQQPLTFRSPNELSFTGRGRGIGPRTRSTTCPGNIS